MSNGGRLMLELLKEWSILPIFSGSIVSLFWDVMVEFLCLFCLHSFSVWVSLAQFGLPSFCKMSAPRWWYFFDYPCKNKRMLAWSAGAHLIYWINSELLTCYLESHPLHFNLFNHKKKGRRKIRKTGSGCRCKTIWIMCWLF